MILKVCLDCRRDKPLRDFPPSARRRDGRGTYCKACMRERSKVSYRKRIFAAGGSVKEPERRLAEGVRRCPDCKEVKPIAAFPRNRSSPSGRGGYCKPCHNTRGKNGYTRLYGSTRSYHLKRRYGITALEFDAMLARQGGTCALCRAAPAEHVDHCHLTNKVRALLCFNCQGRPGNRDDEHVIARALDYLGVHRSLPAAGVTVDA